MLDEGAAIVDIGASRRGPVRRRSLDDELQRVVPVLEALQGDVPVSIDTAKAEVARRAGPRRRARERRDRIAGRAQARRRGRRVGAYVCLMHMLGEPRTMQVGPRYDDVVSEVAAFLEERLRFAVDAGIHEDRICLDPGFGFGKTVEHNFELLRRLDEIVALGRPVLVGISRKRSLGVSSAIPRRPPDSLSASLAAAVMAYDRGATILRVHDVRETVEALTVAEAAS